VLYKISRRNNCNQMILKVLLRLYIEEEEEEEEEGEEAEEEELDIHCL
jgi:hypothetical protein